MKNLLLLLYVAFTLQATGQFIEMGPYNGEIIDVAVMGKDANGLLYGSGAGGIFRKVDDINVPWQSVTSPGGQLIISEVAGFKMYNHFYAEVYSSTNGQDWATENLPGGSSNVVFMQYLDNDHLILCKDDKTLISTNGGSDFQDFFNAPIFSIAWDNLNSRYVYCTGSGLFAKTSVSASPIQLYAGPVHAAPSIPQYGYFMCIDKEGKVYTTERSAFPWIKKYDPSTNTLDQIYPAGSSYPIHARGLFATKTGRTYCIGWSNAGAFLITDDPDNNYISSIPQGGYNSFFMDKAGYLYLNADANGGAIYEKYSKSAYSVRQPVFFNQMTSLMDEGFDGGGFNAGYSLRASDNSLLSIDYKGRVYSSLDDGVSWDSLSQITNINANYSLIKTYAHPSGKIYAGRSGPIVMESLDNGLTWQMSNLTTSIYNGTFVDADYKANGNYSFFIKQDLMLRSTNNGDSLEIMASTDINLPNFGLYKGFTCVEVTNQGTVLVGGRINTGYVYRSTNNLDSITEIMPLGAVQQEIYDIYQDATGKIWMGTYLGLLYSTDDGLTWTKDMDYPELSALEIIENADGKVIIAGSYGNYMRESNTWKRISYGFNSNFIHLFLDPITSRLFAQGNYKTISTSPEIYTALNGVEEPLTKDITLDFYPNPNSGLVYIDNKIGDTGSFTVFNSLGQEILHQDFSSDQETIQLPILDYTPGIYFLVKKTKDKAISKQLILK